MEFKNKTKADILEYVENCVIHYMNYEKLPESMKKHTKELVDKLWAKQLIDVPIMTELLIEEDAWVRDAMNTVKGKEIQKVILTILVEKEWAEKQRRQVDVNGVKACENEEIAWERLKKYEKVRSLGEESPNVYWSIISSLSTLNMIDKAKEVYEDWKSFVIKEEKKQSRTSPDIHQMCTAFYEIEKIMADLCEHNENYEDAKKNLQIVYTCETERINSLKNGIATSCNAPTTINQMKTKLAMEENRRKKTEERIAACEVNLKNGE